MFTEGTRQFGIWKIGHPSIARHSGKPTQAILLAYGFCAFLTWLIFILTLKIRGEFFLIESMNIPLHKIESSSPVALDSGPAGLSLAIRPLKDEVSINVILDSGHAFVLPAQFAELNDHLSDRVSAMELTAMLKKKVTPGLGTAQIWVDERIPLNSVQSLANLLVRLGFDTLRYAVDAGTVRQMEAQ